MRPFRFRLTAALDLRRQQDAEAQRARGVAVLTLQAAEADVRAADEGLSAAVEGSTAAENRGGDPAAFAWHRNWIARWRMEAAHRRTVVAARQADLKVAEAKAMEARRRFKAIDRLRERAWDAYVADRQRLEQQAMDSFGVLRHAIRTRTNVGLAADDKTPEQEETNGE